MNHIRHYLEKLAPCSEADWKEFSSRLVQRVFTRKTVLLPTGKTEQHLSFIEKGIIRFYIPGEENDLTFSFAFENSFVSAYDSFLTQLPCTYHVQAITDTVLWSLTYADLQAIYQSTTVGNTIGRLAAEDLFLKKSRRELLLLTQTPEQLYHYLLTEQPHLIAHIPLKYLASYIGITPQALSRIRKRIS
ncbi:cAMP-binding domain of CRP or a regulatory subunit of cAMP-dependent protein kinases [Filimonas lacunae]|uniref:cAMP-binding domain of CRP or a regulatory subunit of cAMP-dependent protein kinases n=1 Tax=Filimonas lacunae TaxID=477680 RepID=A0A1N7REF1_9BACT|nr:Crp/Fnr family transcriptional regulator [Filimonas lacunae]SIT33432.1 cAMP-binding domain of CRP or a regulatory subunit of cAMP-dependent protein kinases [Filimonas lacunae]